MYEITCTSPYNTSSILTASVLAMNTVASLLIYLYSYCVVVIGLNVSAVEVFLSVDCAMP